MNTLAELLVQAELNWPEGALCATQSKYGVVSLWNISTGLMSSYIKTVGTTEAYAKLNQSRRLVYTVMLPTAIDHQTSIVTPKDLYLKSSDKCWQNPICPSATEFPRHTQLFGAIQ